MKLNSFLSVGLLGLVIGLGSVSMAACGDDDDDNGAAGTKGAAGKGGTGGSGTAGSGTGGSGTAGSGTGGSGTAGSGTAGSGTAGSGTAGAGGGGTLSLYDRLGGHDGLRTFVGGEVTKVVGIDQFKPYFAAQLATPIPPNHPSAPQIVECFSRLVGGAVGEATEVYPGPKVHDAANTATPDFTCRNMVTSHTGLAIKSEDFDAFVTALETDLGKVVTVKDNPTKVLEISQAELGAIDATLKGTKTDIVDK
jgi:hypothetical protein